MNVVLFRSRALFRRRWLAWLGLATILGTVGGVCMAFAQGARRTEVSYRTFVKEQRAADVLIAGKSGFGLVGAVDLDDVEHSSSVAESARAFAPLPFSGATGDGRKLGISDLLPVAAYDNKLGGRIEIWKMTSGRPARPGRIDEATASSELARRMDLRVGSTVHLRLYDAQNFTQTAAHFLQQWPIQLRARSGPASNAPDPADGPSITVRIVGVEASPLEFPPLINDLAPVLHLTPAFAQKYSTKVVGSSVSYVRLKQSSDLKRFKLEIERLAHGRPVSFIATLDNQRAKVERSLHAEALVLAIVAALLALAGLVGVGQALARQAAAEAVDDPVLRALGMQRRQLRAVAMVRALAIGIVATLIALVVALLVSPLTMLSIARLASLDTGFHLECATVVIGAVCVLGFSVVVGLVAAIRNDAGAAFEEPAIARSRVGDAVQRSGLPMSLVLGVRYALQRRGGSASAVMMLMGAALSIATITLAATFTGLLHRDLTEPHRHGWNWDFKLGAPALPDLASQLVPPLRADRRITDLSVGTVTQVDVGRTRLDVIALDVVRGSALPTVISGRAPDGPREIVFGTRSLRAAHTKVDSIITARIGERSATFHVVGLAVFPEFGDLAQLGTGAWTTVAGLQRISPDAAPRNTFLIRLQPTARAAAAEDQIVRAVAPLPVRDAGRPQDLVNLSRGDGLLVALGALLAALALAVLMHALLTSVRRDRCDLAVLRALGRTRGQTRVAVMWQSLTLGAAAFVVGVPVGLVAARWLWGAYARRLGIVPDAFIPFRLLVVVLAGSVVVALVAATIPAWLSARPVVASGLRADD
jgi:putative ABC transport system permease protein